MMKVAKNLLQENSETNGVNKMGQQKSITRPRRMQAGMFLKLTVSSRHLDQALG